MKTLLNNTLIQSKLNQQRTYSPNQIIALEGDLCAEVGLLLNGQVDLIHYSYHGDEKYLASLNVGDFFGDFLLHAEQNRYPGHLIAKETTTIAFIDRATLDTLLKKSDLFRTYYLKNLCNKATKLNIHNKILSQSTLADKIMFFIEHATMSGSQTYLIQSKEALANYLNVTRPSLSRALATLKKHNIIDYNRHAIWLTSTTCVYPQPKAREKY